MLSAGSICAVMACAWRLSSARILACLSAYSSARRICSSVSVFCRPPSAPISFRKGSSSAPALPNRAIAMADFSDPSLNPAIALPMASIRSAGAICLNLSKSRPSARIAAPAAPDSSSWSDSALVSLFDAETMVSICVPAVAAATDRDAMFSAVSPVFSAKSWKSPALLTRRSNATAAAIRPVVAAAPMASIPLRIASLFCSLSLYASVSLRAESAAFNCSALAPLRARRYSSNSRPVLPMVTASTPSCLM